MEFLGIDIAPGVFPVSVLELGGDGRDHRRCVTPDDDISGLPSAARNSINDHWTALGGANAWESIIRPPAPPTTLADIKAEAERRILALLPEWKQRNLTARGVELVLALVKNRGWSPEEAAEAAQIQAQWNKVNAIRDRSNDLEQSLPADFAGNQNWPA
jgi:hypothetical protein